MSATAATRIAIEAKGRSATFGRLSAMRVEPSLKPLTAGTRLDYSTLLEYTPDPLGDWAGGRHDRLARAELASVGLRP
jgi:hypothetical protein